MGVCDIGLWTLFATSFLAATLLPGGSEVVLFGFVHCYPDQWQAGVLTATVGNTLGGMSSYGIGRFFRPPQSFKYEAWVRRYGSITLVLSWVPIVGDLLCVTAGWLRISPVWSAFWMALGKFLRYIVVAGVVTAL